MSKNYRDKLNDLCEKLEKRKRYPKSLSDG